VGPRAVLQAVDTLLQFLSQKTEGKEPLGEPTRMWEDNIKISLKMQGGNLRIGIIYLSTETSGGFL